MIVLRDAVLDDAAAIAEIYNESILNSTATFDTEIKSSMAHTTQCKISCSCC